jgi:hypothetical protein
LVRRLSLLQLDILEDLLLGTLHEAFLKCGQLLHARLARLLRTRDSALRKTNELAAWLLREGGFLKRGDLRINPRDVDLPGFPKAHVGGPRALELLH